MTINRLYLRSRVASSSVIWMLGMSTIAWVLLRSTSEPCFALLVKTITPLGAAVLVGFGARSPFGDAERASGTPLVRLRLMHFTGLFACGAVVLVIAATAEPDRSSLLMMLRNVAGFTGLALLAGAVIGSASAWIVPFTYGSITIFAAMPNNKAGAWAWPVQPGDRLDSAIAALLFLLAGIAVAIRTGARET